MDDPGAHRTPSEPVRRPASVIPWVLLVVLVAAPFVVAAWLFIDREAALEDLAEARRQVAELRQVIGETDEMVADLEAGLEERRAEVARRGEELGRCRRALEQIAAAWNDLAQAVEAAGALDAEEARSLAARANVHRRASERAADRCG